MRFFALNHNVWLIPKLPLSSGSLKGRHSMPALPIMSISCEHIKMSSYFSPSLDIPTEHQGQICKIYLHYSWLLPPATLCDLACTWVWLIWSPENCKRMSLKLSVTVISTTKLRAFMCCDSLVSILRADPTRLYTVILPNNTLSAVNCQLTFYVPAQDELPGGLSRWLQF